MNFIDLENVSVTYSSGKVPVAALKNVSLSIEKGRFYAIVGKSGCGKTTLLNVLGGILPLQKGTYTFFGEDVTKFNHRALARFRNESVGIVVQHFALIQDLQTYDNVALPLKCRHMKRADIDSRVREAMGQVDILKKMYDRPFELSGGQQQRVAIARAIVTHPPLLLADEPTGALDESTGREIMSLFHQLNREGMTIVMVTHDMELASEADVVIQMSDGCIDRKK